MQFTYESATAILAPISPRSAKLVNVFSKNPGKGHATGLLYKVVQYADEHDIDVFLIAKRYGYNDSRGLNNRNLVEFYQRFGFELVGESKSHMYRASQKSHAL